MVISFGNLLGVTVAINCFIFFVTFLQQFQPLATLDPDHFQGTAVTWWQARGVHVLVEGFAVSTVENYPAAQFFLEEGFE